MKQYQIVVVNLYPTIGGEIKKTRPCIIISPNEMNETLKTIIIAPITSTPKKHPTRVKINSSNAKGMIALDQIRTIDKKRIVDAKRIVSSKTIIAIKDVLEEMLIK